MLDLSDIKSSPEELQDYYAQLRAQHVTPAWIGGGISAGSGERLDQSDSRNRPPSKSIGTRALEAVQGTPRRASLSAAITTALTLRAVFRLALRQTEGLIASLLRLLDLDLAAPDHSTISRRDETLPVSRPRAGSEPVHLLVDTVARKAFKTFYENLDGEARAKIDQAVEDLGITDGKEAWEKAEHALRQSRSLAGRTRLALHETWRSWKAGDATPLIWGTVILLALGLAGLLGSAISDWFQAGSRWLGGIGIAATLGVLGLLSRFLGFAGGVLGLFERASRRWEEACRLALSTAEKGHCQENRLLDRRGSA